MYDHRPLTLPIADAQKTKATESARLRASHNAILDAIFAIDNIKGSDIQTTALLHVAQQLRIMRDGKLQRESREQLDAVDLAAVTASRADAAERDARQEERRKKHPVLADAAEHAVIVEADKVREKCPILLGPWSSSKTLADVEEPRPLPKITHHFTLEEIRVASDEYAGFCIACGAYQDTCEPDARNYKCEECGELQVFGADELGQMGLVK